MQNLRTGIYKKPYSHFGAFSNKCIKSKKPHLKSDTITYLFSFNGKEKIDEINGAGNNLDFGARIYDSRLGRWFACDKLLASHSSESPYIFSGNSPIKFIDFDGNDYGVIIDHEKGTILLVANIYTINEEAHIQALAAANELNSINKTVSIDGRKYSLSFVVRVDPVDGSTLPMAMNDPIGNAYYGTRGVNDIDGNEGFTGGITTDNKNIAMYSLYFNKTLSDGSSMPVYYNAGDNFGLLSHEYLHLFGLDDKETDGKKNLYFSFGGRMEYTAQIPNFKLNPISNGDILNILYHAISNNGKDNTGEGNVYLTQSCEYEIENANCETITVYD
jgi:RHS repeat-associated protein